MSLFRKLRNEDAAFAWESLGATETCVKEYIASRGLISLLYFTASPTPVYERKLSHNSSRDTGGGKKKNQDSFPLQGTALCAVYFIILYN